MRFSGLSRAGTNLCRPSLETLQGRILLSVFTVDRLTDFGEGTGYGGDLRYCLTHAMDGDRVRFAVTGAINLVQQLPDLDRSIAIEGPGPDLLTVRPSSEVYVRIFRVDAGATVDLSGLTVSGGSAYYLDQNGGGIYNAGSLTVRNSRISENYANVYGAGIFNVGRLTISYSSIAANMTGIGGDPRGGGIYNEGELTLRASIVTGNTAFTKDLVGEGSGIYNAGAVTVDNSTISHNGSDAFTGSGAGIYNVGALRLAHSTITGNRTPLAGAGIYGPILEMRDTIVAGNFGNPEGSDLFGQIASSGYNLIGDSHGGSGYTNTDLLDVDPNLGPLQDNGGPTFTHALLPGSPAIDAGDNTDAPRWDQRGPGFPRIVNGAIDIGAFEVQDPGRRAGSKLAQVPSSVDPPSAGRLSWTFPASFPSRHALTDEVLRPLSAQAEGANVPSGTSAPLAGYLVPITGTAPGTVERRAPVADSFWLGEGAEADPEWGARTVAVLG